MSPGEREPDAAARPPHAAGSADGSGRATTDGSDAGSPDAPGPATAGRSADGTGADTTGPAVTGDAAGTAVTGDSGGGGASAGRPADGGAGADFDPLAAAARRRDRATRGTLAAALCLEAITVLFVPRTVARVGDGGLTGARLAIVIAIAIALFLTAGLVKRRAGLVLGSVLQVAVIATGVLVGAMYFLGVLFAAVWAYALWVRNEINQAAAEHGEPATDGGPRTA